MSYALSTPDSPEKKATASAFSTSAAKTPIDKSKEAAAKRLRDEAVLTGRVQTAAYKTYFKALGYVSSVVLIANFLLNQAISTGKRFSGVTDNFVKPCI